MWLSLTRPLLGTWPETQARALTGNQTGDPLVHRPALGPLSHASQGTSFPLIDEGIKAQRGSGLQGHGAGRWMNWGLSRSLSLPLSSLFDLLEAGAWEELCLGQKAECPGRRGRRG